MGKYFFTLVMIAASIFPFSLKSETEFFGKGTLDIRINGSYMTSSSFFDQNGKQKTSLQEKLSNPDTTKRYLFTFRSYTIGLQADYSIMDHWAVFANIPIAHYTLSQTYERDELGNNTEKADYSLTQPVYYGLGSRYRLIDGPFTGAALVEVRIPPGFHNGILDDSSYQILNDGAFELLTGLAGIYKMKTSSLEADVLYNHRQEELGDRVLVHAGLNLKTVPQTELSAFTNMAIPLSPVDNTLMTDIRRQPLQEAFVRAGFGFGVFDDKNFHARFSYEVTLWGQNTWSTGVLNLTVGVYL